MHASHPAPSLDIRRQAGVDEALGVGDRPPVEPGDPGRERVYERVELGIRQGAVHVAIGLSLVGADVVRAQEHLQRTVSTNELG